MGAGAVLRWSCLAALAAAFACSSTKSDAPAPAPPQDDAGAPPAPTCDDGDTLVGSVCQPLLVTTACAPGTRAALGSATCVAVGTKACAAGFTAHASGWGCVPVLPAAACTGATRDALGSASCVPIGDCSAAFPPAAATVFVDATFTDGQVDAAHFKTIAAAIAGAAAKATIAVAPGTYAESLAITKEVSLVGQCAEKVTLDAPAGPAAIGASADFTLSGITVRGGSIGIDVLPPAHASIADVVLDQNFTTGISATEHAVVDVTRSVIRGTRPATPTGITNGIFVDVGGTVTFTESVVSGAADAGVGATGDGVITLDRSIVRDIVKRPDGVGGTGVRVFEGAHVSLQESAVVDAIATGVLAGMTKGGLTMLRSTVLGTKSDTRFVSATAASLTNTGTLDATDSTFADNAITGVAVDQIGARATLDSCVIVNTTPAASGPGVGVGTAASVSNGGALQVKSSAIIASKGIATYALHKASTMTIDSSLIGDVASATTGSGGTAVVAIDTAHVTLTSSTIQDCHEIAIGALEVGTTLLIDRTLVSKTMPNQGALFGHGVFGERKAAVTVRRSVIEQSTGIGLVFSGATASIQGSFVRNNNIGIHAQDGSTIATGATAPGTIDPLVVFVTDDTQFDGNATRVGSGTLPLPSIIQPTQ